MINLPVPENHQANLSQNTNICITRAAQICDLKFKRNKHMDYSSFAAQNMFMYYKGSMGSACACF